jgi:hypothetical protein
MADRAVAPRAIGEEVLIGVAGLRAPGRAGREAILVITDDGESYKNGEGWWKWLVVLSPLSPPSEGGSPREWRTSSARVPFTPYQNLLRSRHPRCPTLSDVTC